MVFALSTGHQIGLAGTGAAFIIFALISSFVLPARDPNFPGNGLRWYLPLTVAFFLAMMAAVFVFGREKKAGEAKAAAPPAATSTSTSTAPSSSLGPKLTSGPYANGDPTAGATVFKSAGCNACHTLKAAGASGTVGPDLDKLADDAQQAHQPLEQFAVAAITHPPPPYVPKGYPTNVMPTTFAKTLTPKQIADLVAFLYQSAQSP